MTEADGHVSGAGTSTIRIEGRLNGFTYTCIPGRIVAGTFMVVLAGTLKGKVASMGTTGGILNVSSVDKAYFREKSS